MQPVRLREPTNAHDDAMTPGRLSLCLVAALAVALSCGHRQARATPLDGETCAVLQSEHGQLKDAGVDKELEKSPMWALANLAPEKLAQVKRYIELEEQLLFRCRSRSLIHLHKDPEPASPEDAGGQNKKEAEDADRPEPDAAAAGPVKEPKQKPKAAPRKAIAGPSAAKSKAQEPGKKPAAKAAAQPAPASRPPAKADDALKVPPPDPRADPFAHQLKLPANQ
jgi:hypothetical protein